MDVYEVLKVLYKIQSQIKALNFGSASYGIKALIDVIMEELMEDIKEQTKKSDEAIKKADEALKEGDDKR